MVSTREMSSLPLSTGEQAKIILFFLIMIPLIAFFGLGLIFIVLFIFCTHLAKRNRSTATLEAAISSFRVLLLVAVGIFILVAAFGASLNDWPQNRAWYDKEMVVVSLFWAVIFFVYFLLTGYLFLKPVQRNRDWISQHGFFASRERKSGSVIQSGSPDIRKSEKLLSYSVADELIKWSKLKDQGHITLEEYQRAREKLLGD